ncbi:MAG: SDR family NAD(P)-dependent oxidoreductase [Acidobacteria bacterium]|nr:SDR family NAD(P)-dependent oxidoreductase [Acidobacteriota bacterium]
MWLTGASSGIGEALVPALTGAGARLAITARRADRLEALAAAHARPGRPILVMPADVTDREAVRQAVEAVERAWGGIDLALLNAGAGKAVTVRGFSTDTFRSIMDVNFFGVLHGIEAVLPGMLERRAGRIAGVASLAGYRAGPGLAGYGSSKAALIHALESLRFGLAPHGIGITVINPGFVRTPMTAVNQYWMPALMEVDRAAALIVRGLQRDKKEIHFPIRLSWTLKVLRVLPFPIYERIMTAFVKPEA